MNIHILRGKTLKFEIVPKNYVVKNRSISYFVVVVIYL